MRPALTGRALPHHLGLTLLLIFALSAPEAQAARLSSRAWAGAHLASTRPGSADRQLGPGGQLGMELAFGDFWGVWGGLDASYHLGRGSRELTPATVHDLFLGARYNFDVFKYVPFIGVGLVGYLDAPPTAEQVGAPGLGGKLTIGVLWRPRRHWSIGGVIELHGALADLTRFGLYTSAGLNVGYHWRW